MHTNKSFLVASLLLAGVAGLRPCAPAQAQDSANSSGAFWVEEQRRVQRLRPPQQVQRVRRLMPHRELARPTLWPERIHTAAPPPPLLPAQQPALAATRAPAPQPSPAAVLAPTLPAGTPPFLVGVIGDNLAQGLTAGLNETFPPGGGVTVLGRAHESSGLVRDDYFDWPKALRDLLANTKVDVLVVMVGSNDRQALRGPNGSEEPLSSAWEALYGARVKALIEVAREKSVPVLWVGMPIMKSERFADDMDAINAIDRTRGEAGGAHFIDVYDAFADEKGQYSAFGPDVNGQYVKLRTGDGIHFTPPGARKLAHFVEGEIRRLHDASRPAPAVPEAQTLPETAIAALPPAPPPAFPLPAAAVLAAPDKPAIGPVIALTAAPVSPGGDLDGRSGLPRLTDSQRTAIETLLMPRGNVGAPVTLR